MEIQKRNAAAAAWLLQENKVLQEMRTQLVQQKMRNLDRVLGMPCWRRLFMRLREKTGFVSKHEKMMNAKEAKIRSQEVRSCKGHMEILSEKRKKYLMVDRAEQIRDMSSKFVFHISPLEIINDPWDPDFINVVAKDINQIELVIILIDHRIIHQYWTPKSATTSSSSSCQHLHHPRDDDDEEMMILAVCRRRPLLDSSLRLRIILGRRRGGGGGGVFADRSKKKGVDEQQHIMSILSSSFDALFEHGILPTRQNLEDLKTSITSSISEAKPHVARVKPKRVRICVHINRVQKQYYGSAQEATFYAAQDHARQVSHTRDISRGLSASSECTCLLMEAGLSSSSSSS